MRKSKSNPSRLSMATVLLASSLASCAATPVATSSPNADGEVIPAGEASATAALTDAIRASVQSGFDQNGHAFRDAHRKSHGCVQATFTVLDKIPPQMAQGLFATPRAYNAVVRFSNGSGSSQDDHNNDARGMALKIMGVGGTKLLDDEQTASTQDFLMTNHPVFFVRNATDYVAFQKAATNGGLALTGWLATHLFHETPIILGFTGHKVLNPLNSRYWSSRPGPAQAAPSSSLPIRPTA